jgi:Flp pilus assembly protein TadD
MKRTLVVCAACVVLMGCVGTPVREGGASPRVAAGPCAPLDSTADVQLGLVRQMLEQGRPYAGLAHLATLDAAVQTSPQARYLNAELLRNTGQPAAAEAGYKSLLGSCVEGYGHHGLGLLAAGGDLEQAVIALRTAAEYLPIDARVRNDFGYALLLAGNGAEARHEFLTAMELGDYKRRASMNLVLLMLFEGDERGAERLSRQLQLPEGDLDRIRRQAIQLQQKPKTETKGEG